MTKANSRATIIVKRAVIKTEKVNKIIEIGGKKKLAANLISPSGKRLT